MMKITSLIARKKQQLKAAKPKSRDRIRYRLQVLAKVQELRKRPRAA